jgi:hypothetical protein
MRCDAIKFQFSRIHNVQLFLITSIVTNFVDTGSRHKLETKGMEYTFKSDF